METIYRRRFLLEDLPAPLTRASEHLQFFDNFLTETRLFLRKIRSPKTRTWAHKLIQEYPLAPTDLSKLARSEIELSEYEYEVLSVFEGNELRFNRYRYEHKNQVWKIDLILNRELWNLVLGSVEFDSDKEMQDFKPADFVVREITHDDFFAGAKLVDATLDDVRRRLESAKN